MSTATPTAHVTANPTIPCPECAAAINFARTPLRGEVIRCAECAAELEVTALDPLTVELAPQVEEDWGE